MRKGLLLLGSGGVDKGAGAGGIILSLDMVVASKHMSWLKCGSFQESAALIQTPNT